MIENTRTILGIEFTAIRKDRPRLHWVYAVEGREGPQHYKTRPAMWEDLERAARIRGADQWAKDWARFTAKAA